MSTFLVRIELHDADKDDYNELHAEMQAKGFLRTIYGSDKTTYQLPTAEYQKETPNDIQLTLIEAQIAAVSVGKNFGLLVVEAKNIMWEGLVPVNKS